MHQPAPKKSADPFEGLMLTRNAWKALEDADIRSLKQMIAMAPHIEYALRTDRDTVRVIKKALDRLAARRILRVRLAFPKRYRQA